MTLKKRITLPSSVLLRVFFCASVPFHPFTLWTRAAIAKENISPLQNSLPSPLPSPAPPSDTEVSSSLHLGQRSLELCEKASHTDWLYIASFGALVVGSVVLDSQVLKQSSTPTPRVMGSGIVGLTVGAWIGGAYLSLPKCEPTLDGTTPFPPEGEIRSPWPIALSLAMASGVIAPLFVAIEKGTIPKGWEVSERSTHFILAGITGFGGALLPYLHFISPKPWRAYLERSELAILPAQAGTGLYANYTFRF